MKNRLSKLIESEQSKRKNKPRNYIGASSIGSDCLRQIWYEYQGEQGEPITPKLMRTFDIGKQLEALVMDWLEESGIPVARIWTDLKSENVPEFQGHLDAVWTNQNDAFVIIEIKTANDASFKAFVKKGLKLWNPQYYTQIQSYMGMSGIKSTYIVVLNKDSSELSDELVIFDEVFYREIEGKAIMIRDAKLPPPKINGSPLWYQCKQCKFNKVCHEI